MVHRPVEVLGLAGVGVSHGNPGVCGQQARSVRLPRFGERAAGTYQHPGQGVDNIALTRHG
ncbi:MAG: hypothetical protein ACREOE_13310 [Gemmatimonadales bacterium]